MKKKNFFLQEKHRYLYVIEKIKFKEIKNKI